MRGIELPTNLVIIYLLIHLRFVGLMFSSPVFAGTLSPLPFRYIFATALTACSIGIIKAESIPVIYFENVITLGILCVRELIIGAALGYISALPLYALRIFGEQTGSIIGFSMAQIMDPTTQSETSIVGELGYLVAMWFYFRWNGHLVMLQAVIETFKLVPPGQINLMPSGDLQLGSWLQAMFTLGIRMVVPFYCACVLSDIGLGFLARTVPQMNIFVVGLPVKVMLGFMVLAAVLPLTMDLVYTQFERWVEFALSVLRLWRPLNG